MLYHQRWRISPGVKKIPRGVKSSYPQIPWKDMSSMRDKLTHEYFGVNLQVIWDTIKQDIPVLKPLMQKVLDDSRE